MYKAIIFTSATAAGKYASAHFYQTLAHELRKTAINSHAWAIKLSKSSYLYLCTYVMKVGILEVFQEASFKLTHEKNCDYDKANTLTTQLCTYQLFVRSI